MVKEYLLSNPHVLEAFINEHVSEETLRTLLYKKALNARPKTPAQAESFPQGMILARALLRKFNRLAKVVHQKHRTPSFSMRIIIYIHIKS